MGLVERGGSERELDVGEKSPDPQRSRWHMRGMGTYNKVISHNAGIVALGSAVVRHVNHQSSWRSSRPPDWFSL